MSILTAAIGSVGEPWILGGAAIAAGLLVTWGGVQTYRVSSAKEATAVAQKATSDLQVKYDQQVITAQKATLDFTNLQASITDQRAKDRQEIIDAAQKIVVKARAEVTAADASARRVSDYADHLAATASKCSSASNNPSTGGGGATATDSSGVLADLLKRADKRAGLLAEYADAARDAGLVCEQSYDSLNKATR